MQPLLLLACVSERLGNDGERLSLWQQSPIHSAWLQRSVTQRMPVRLEEQQQLS